MLLPKSQLSWLLGFWSVGVLVESHAVGKIQILEAVQWIRYLSTGMLHRGIHMKRDEAF